VKFPAVEPKPGRRRAGAFRRGVWSGRSHPRYRPRGAPPPAFGGSGVTHLSVPVDGPDDDELTVLRYFAATSLQLVNRP